MPRFNTVQNNFQAGELSSKMFGRVDVPEYFRGCSRLENVLVLPQGGASKRPGSRFMWELSSYASKDILDRKRGQILWRSTPTTNNDPGGLFSRDLPVFPAAGPDSLYKRGDYLYIGNGNDSFFTGIIAKFSLLDQKVVWAYDLSSGTNRTGDGVFATLSGRAAVIRLGQEVRFLDTDGTSLGTSSTSVPDDYACCFGDGSILLTLHDENVQSRGWGSAGITYSNDLSVSSKKTSIHGDDDLANLFVGAENGTVTKCYYDFLSGMVVVGAFSFTDPDGDAITSIRYDQDTQNLFVGTTDKVYRLNSTTGAVIWVDDTIDGAFMVRTSGDVCFVRHISSPLIRRYLLDGSFEDISTDPHYGAARAFEALSSTSVVISHEPYLLDDDSNNKPEFLALSFEGFRNQSVFDEFEKLIPFTSASGIPYIICLKRKPLAEKNYDIKDQLAIFRAYQDVVTPVDILDFFYAVIGSVTTTRRNIIDIDTVYFAQSGDVLVLVDGNGPPVIFAWESDLLFSVMGWGISSEFATSSTPTKVSSFRNTSSAGRIFKDITPFMRFPYQPRNVSANLGIRRRLTDAGEMNALQLVDASNTVLLPVDMSSKSLVSRRSLLTTFSTTETPYPEGLALANIVTTSATGSLETFATTDNFRFSYWGGTPQGFLSFRNPLNNNWPRTVAFFEQRAVFAGSRDFPDTVWMSMVGNFLHMMSERLIQDQGVTSDASGNNFFGDVRPTDPLDYTIGATDVSNVAWIMPAGNGLEIGTTTREYLATGGQGGIITNENLLVRAESRVGSDTVQPVRAGNVTFFVGAGGRDIYSFVFDNDTQRMRPVSTTNIAEGIVDHNISLEDGDKPSRIVELVYQQSLRVLWCRTSNGEVLGLTYDPEHGTQAWYRLTLGRAEGERVKIKGMCVLPSADGLDELFLNVWRSFDGKSSVALEKIGLPFDVSALVNPSSASKDKPFFSDSCIRLVFATPQSVITGLERFEGKAVQILADGFQEPSQVVTGGEITLVNPSKEIYIGLGYRSVIRLMPLESQGSFGDSTGELKRIHRLGLRFYRTWDADVSVGGFPDEQVSVRSTNVSLGDPIPEFTGIRNMHPSSNPEVEHVIEVSSSSPYPMTLLSVTKRGEIYG